MDAHVKKTLDALMETERLPYNVLHALRLVYVRGKMDRYECEEPLLFGREHALRSAFEQGDLVLGEHRDLLLRTRRHYELSEQGRSMLESEIAKLEELGDRVIKATSQERAKIIKEGGYEPHDYIVKRLLLVYGAFDKEYSFFESGRLGERIEQVASKARLKKRKPTVVKAPAVVETPVEKVATVEAALPIIVSPMAMPAVVPAVVPEVSMPVPAKRSWWRLF